MFFLLVHHVDEKVNCTAGPADQPVGSLMCAKPDLHQTGRLFGVKICSERCLVWTLKAEGVLTAAGMTPAHIPSTSTLALWFPTDFQK